MWWDISDHYEQITLDAYTIAVFFIFQIFLSHLIYCLSFKDYLDWHFQLAIPFDDWDVQFLKWLIWIGLPLLLFVALGRRLWEYCSQPGPAILSEAFLGDWYVEDNYVATIEERRIVWADRLTTELRTTTRVHEIYPEPPVDSPGCRGSLHKMESGVYYILWTSGDIWSKEPHDVVRAAHSRRASMKMKSKQTDGEDFEPIDMDYINGNQRNSMRASAKRKRTNNRKSPGRTRAHNQTYLGKTPGEAGAIPPPPPIDQVPNNNRRSSMKKSRKKPYYVRMPNNENPYQYSKIPNPSPRPSHMNDNMRRPRNNQKSNADTKVRRSGTNIPPPPSHPPPPKVNTQSGSPNRRRKGTGGQMFLAARPPMLLEAPEVAETIIPEPGSNPAWYFLGIPLCAYIWTIGMFIRDKYSVWAQIIFHFAFHYCLWKDQKKFLLACTLVTVVTFLILLFLVNLRLTLGLPNARMVWNIFL